MSGVAAAPLARNPAYLKLWLIGLLAGVVRWLEMLAFGIYAFDTTGSPTLVALLVMLRFLPLAVFGVLVGALSDLAGPRRLLVGGLAGVALVAATMAALFRWGEPGYTAVAVATFLSGAFWAGDMPVRRRMVGDAVADERLTGAMALDGAANNATRMLGPLVGGVLYGAIGIEGVFVTSAVFYAVALAVAATLPGEHRPARGTAAVAWLGEPFRQVAEAVRYALAHRDVLRILLVTIVFNVWGFPYMTMVPVIGREELGLAPGTVGAVTALEGLFALMGALMIARNRRSFGLRRLYVGAVLALFATTFTIGVVTGFWVLALGLAVGGLCASGFAAMQATLIYVVAPAAMRGRLLGLMTICIGAGVLGLANVGITAELVGASNALWIIALQGLVPLLLVSRRWPELWARA